MWATDGPSRRTRPLRRTLRAMCLAVAALDVAAAPPTVTDADIERARQQHRMPTDAELARIPVPASPRIDNLPQPATPLPIDLEAISRGFDLEAAAPPMTSPSGKGRPTVLIFVSFAMPEVTLQRLLDQAARAGATLVLRGLVNGSIRDTVARMQPLIGKRRVAVQIDPQAFERFGVVRTPTFVLVKGGATAEVCSSGLCVAESEYVKVAGDVTVDYAMRHMADATGGLVGEPAAPMGRAPSRD